MEWPNGKLLSAAQATNPASPIYTPLSEGWGPFAQCKPARAPQAPRASLVPPRAQQEAERPRQPPGPRLLVVAGILLHL